MSRGDIFRGCDRSHLPGSDGTVESKHGTGTFKSALDASSAYRPAAKAVKIVAVNGTAEAVPRYKSSGFYDTNRGARRARPYRAGNLRHHGSARKGAGAAADALHRHRIVLHAAAGDVSRRVEPDPHQQPGSGDERIGVLDPGTRAGAIVRMDRHVHSRNW